MKLFHLSDLHIGKRVHEFSMLDDQEYILGEIIRAAGEHKPDGIILAGDIYDKSLPSAEAVQLFDDFLYKLSALGVKVFVISGNHDSPERISFGGRIMDRSGVYLSPVYSGAVTPVTLTDEYGEADVFMLPFVRPANVKRFFPDEEIATYTDAVRAAVSNMPVKEDRRNILIAHQFVTGAAVCDSEDISVGGMDNVDCGVFGQFDYVALGHLHGPQHISRETVRYCGTPLKYSFSEIKHNKSITLIEFCEKGKCVITELPLCAKRGLAEVRGTYEELTAKSFYAGLNLDDYYHITLLDEDDVPEALGRLRAVYKNIMLLDYDNKRTRSGGVTAAARDVERKSPLELFSEFFEAQNGKPMSGKQQTFVASLVEKIWEGGN